MEDQVPRDRPLSSVLAQASRARFPGTSPAPSGSIIEDPRSNSTSYLPDFDFEAPAPHNHLPTSHALPESHTQQSRPGDFLTPEYSSENPFSEHSAHTSPSIEDFLWEQSFNDTLADSESQGIDLDASGERLYHERDLQGLSTDLYATTSKPHATQLLSPRSTTTPSPPELANRRLQGSTSTIGGNRVTSSPTPGNQRMLGHIDTSQRKMASNQSSLNVSPTEPIARAVSPVVMISSYTRGDSPSRPHHSLWRRSSKRSQDGSHSMLSHRSNMEENTTSNEIGNTESHVFASSATEDNGILLHDTAADRAGLAPADRGDEEVLSLKDMDQQRQLYERNAEVETWLSRSEVGSDAGDKDTQQTRRNRSRKDKRLVRSTGERSDKHGLGIHKDSIPGPGVLLDEDSGEDWSDENESQTSSSVIPESPPTNVNMNVAEEEHDYFPSAENMTPEAEEPLPRQFYRRTPWQDSVKGLPTPNTKDQPSTSNAAMMKYDRQAAQFETASRAATWGTRRRLSESEVQSIVEGSKVRHLSLTKNKTRERGASFLNKARGLIPHRSNSNLKKKSAENSAEEDSSGSSRNRGESLSSMNPLQRKVSAGKAKSPSPNSGHQRMAVTGHLTAAGRSTSTTPDTGLSSPLNMLKRHRSKSEIPKSSNKNNGTPGLAELMTKHGGPPMPTLASPMQERPYTNHADMAADDDDDDEDDEDIDDKGIRMDLKIRADSIIPTLEGFKTNAQQLNPRLVPFLLDRIATEQVRRYKKLVEHKVKHTRAVVQHKCPSGKYCFELDGAATLLPPRANNKGPEATYAQFQVSGGGESDDDDSGLAEGLVTPALFPPGIPLPPVKRLPAEFECSLCFKVKKFQKPSDWTKHVHEDVQPFTCTFPNCTEPKSFKRKADWVRHENERHRHLEWWKCNVPECAHICYRKDNFVQHLVREHKKPEPKVKSRGSGSSKLRPANGGTSAVRQQAEDQEEIWQLVELCHAETMDKPRNEACKFCGNICSSWKKLTVHLGKHMEQIAMPVLELVKQREVSPETIISPIERGYQPQPMGVDAYSNVTSRAEQMSLSPNTVSAASIYQGSPASQSPMGVQVYSRNMQPQNGPVYSGYGSLKGEALQPLDMGEFARVHGLPPNMSYGPYQEAYQQQPFTAINSPAPATYPPAQHAIQRSPLQAPPHIPRSQPMQTQMSSLDVHSSPTAMYYPQQQLPYASPIEADPYFRQYHAAMTAQQGLSQPTSDMEYSQMLATSMPILDDQLYDPEAHARYGGPAQAPHTGYQYQ